MTTQQFELPAACPTCQAMRTEWNINNLGDIVRVFVSHLRTVRVTDIPSLGDADLLTTTTLYLE